VQNAGDAVLAAAVNANDRYIVYKLEADWGRNGLYNHTLSDLTSVVKSLSVVRDTNNSLPEEVTLVEGFHGSQMSVTLGGKRPGDTLTIAHRIAMWRTDSVLFGTARTGVPIRAYIGHRVASGVQTLVQQFQGVITECRVTSSGLEASLVCQDYSALVRAAVSLPAWAMPPAISKYSGGSLVLKTNSQWALDYVFRRNGYFMTPPCHARTFFAATLHGSPAPERGHRAWFWISEGYLDSSTAPYMPGRPGWGLAWGGSQQWWAAISYRANFTGFAAAVNQTLVLQCQVNTDYADRQFPGQTGNLVSWSTGAGYLSGSSWILSITSTKRMQLNAYRDSTLVASVLGPTLGAGWQDCSVEIELGASLATSTYRWVGGTTSAVDLSGLTNPVSVLYSTVVLFAQLPMHDLQISDRTGLASGSTLYNVGTWASQVDLDIGLNDVIGLPIRYGVNSWDLLKEIVAAEYGILGFSEAGRPFFKNRNTTRASTLTTVKTLDQSKVLVDFGMTERADTVRNNISSTYTPRYITGPNDATGVYETIYSLDDPSEIQLPPGQTNIDVVLNSPLAQADLTQLTQFTTVQWNDTTLATSTNQGFVTQNMAGIEVATGVTCTVLVPLSPQDTGLNDVLRLVFVNTGVNYLQFKTTDGHPALRVRGLKYYDGDKVTQSFKRSGSITKYGERVFEIPTSDWHQMPTSLQRVSVSLLKDLGSPVPIVDQVQAVGDCRVQLQDTTQIEDRGGLGGPMFCSTMGITRQLTVSGQGAKLVDSLTVRPQAAPGKWILGHSVWSILGSTTTL
jgi:hypothetical protein